MTATTTTVPLLHADGSARFTTLLRLAVSGGRADRTRIALTATGSAVATVALSAAASVAVSGPGDGPYTSEVLNQPGLHVGVVTALVLLCLPVLGFVGQCSRIGAPGRDRRLAALRLQGATPGDVVRVAVVETGLSAVLGTVAGLGLFFALRVLLDVPTTATYDVTTVDGDSTTVETVTGAALPFPTDVLPPWPVLLVFVLAIPLAAAVFATFAMRRVVVTPFGVDRSQPPEPRRIVPAILFVAGTVVMVTFESLLRFVPHRVLASEFAVALFLVPIGLTLAGLLMGTTTLASLVGEFIARRTARPALLLAARRMVSAPSHTSRANSTLLLVVLLAAFTQGIRAKFLAETANYGTTFYADTFDLVNLALVLGAVIAAAGLLVGTVDGVLGRRHVLAGLHAVGVPRGTITRSVLGENLLALVPAVVLATAAGIVAARGLFGTSVTWSDLQADGTYREVVAAVGVPWGSLGGLVVVVLAAAALATVASFPVLRVSLHPSELRAD
ncbi:FtsX-like permease family protein [Kineococcus sp. GCM10028916]|uniref:FtsX-like permease family protein n=1 Tax=Kineococcus sp. GCM10028916 TaxID=3273394 RepID=UPI003640E63E